MDDKKDNPTIDKVAVAAESPPFDDGNADAPPLPKVMEVPWLRQLQCVLIKNALLLSRRPFQLVIMSLSSVVSVLLAFWALQGEIRFLIDFDTVPLNKCGTVDPEFVADMDWEDAQKVPITHNEPWRDGLSVTLMALGPMFHAVLVFVIIQVDIQTQMLGILRGLGMRDSVFWASWWTPFLVTSCVNSIGAAITAAALSTHAFEHIYFMGVFGSFFFLNIALVGASFFLAALCGTARGGAATWCIILLLVAQWVTFMVQAFQSRWVDSPQDLEWIHESPIGLFWTNRDTERAVVSGYYDWEEERYINTFNSTCEVPIISKALGNLFRMPDDPDPFQEDDFFLGCYFTAGHITSIWNQDTNYGLAVLFMFPYVHFASVWGNFLGFTAMPDRSFGSEHASMSSEELAMAALPTPLDPNHGHSEMFAQGVTLNTVQNYYSDYNDPGYFLRTNCPSQDLRDDFCNLGTQCTSASEVSPTTSPSVLDLFGFLFALSIIYTLIGAYWAQVFPGKNGAPRKFYFFLIPSYWLGTKIAPSEESANQVEIQEARKSYGGFEAVKGVSMTMESGEVTALLGHNGAGKTTLSHILSCEIGATSGDVSVFGHSVVDDPDAVRGLVAVCKQDDYLYPDLSAKEHLDLFGGLRGVRSKELPAMVQKWLESVDLLLVQNQYSSAFSGGMKRRLSLACSTIGGRPLIILDEPTTGMDPLSRRFVWRHIDEVKEGRVVLLTTHAMEEADLLADSVAIMRKGELAAYGTPLELKSQYGSALQFSLLVEAAMVDKAQQDIQRHFKKHQRCTEIVSGGAGNITVKIHAVKLTDDGEGVDANVLTNFVSWLEDEPVSGVTEYGFSNSSLEEVFLKVTQADDEEHKETDALDEYDVCCPGCSRSCILWCLGGCCRCCCCPRRRARMDTENEHLDELAISQAGGVDSSTISTFIPVLSTWSQSLAILYFTVFRHWIGKWSSWVFYTFLVGSAMLLVVRATNSFASIAFLAAPTAFLSLAIVTFISPIYRDRNLGVLYLMRAQGLLKSSFLLGNGVYAFVIQFILAFVMLSLMYASGLYQAPEICDLENYYYCEPKLWSWTRLAEVNEIWRDRDSGATVYATWQGGGYWKMLLTAFAFSLTTPGVVFSSAYVPGFKLAIVSVVTISILASVTPLICYFLLAPKRYDTCLPDICNATLGEFADLEDMESSGREFLNCVGTQVSQASGSLCLPSSAGILPQFSLFQMLTMTLVGDILFVSDPPEYVEEVFIPQLKKGDVRCGGNTCQFPAAHDHFLANFGFMILGAVLLLVLGFCLVSFFSFPSGVALRIRHFLSQVWKVISLEERRERKETSNGEDDIKPFEEVVKESEVVGEFVRCRQFEAEHHEALDEETGTSDAPNGVDAGTPSSDELPLVLAHKLRKVYPSLGGVPPKVALASLDLHVPKGQVLGLLGQNGAGKTTAIKIWAGSHDATSGLALVAGYDVSSETLNVFERLGNCPQFDVVCPSETVQRHLEFFALLKGLPMQKVRPIAKSIATAVGLGQPEVYHRHASRLSGGMRRRLSIAISLIGAPSVLLLDEPTTGLDPSTRNSIWNLINSFATRDRAIIITTHMMLEADTLCNRIAIMAHGKLKVVGTQQALKDRFGSGYLLQLNLVKSTPDNQEKALHFVRENIHEDAVLQNRQAKTLRVALPRDVNLANVFRVLYSKEITSEGCINQFLLSQSSLEDVFIALGD